MINICQPLMISRKHAYALLSVMLILIIVNHLCILDSICAEIKKLSNKFIISSVLTEGHPVTAAQNGVNVVTNLSTETLLYASREALVQRPKTFRPP